MTPPRPWAGIVVVVLAVLGSGHAGARLTGKVITSGGPPVRRAHVVVAGPTTITTDADPEGVFHLEGLTQGTYVIAATKAGFIEAGPSVVGVVDVADQLDVTIVMTLGGAISGRVLDSLGSPLADTPVALRQSNAALSLLTTDDRGMFRFHTLRAGIYELVWSTNEKQTVTVVPGRTVDVELVSASTANVDSPATSTFPADPREDLQPLQARTVRGRITSAETGSPLSHVTVRLNGEASQRTETSESGRFVFRDVPDGRYSIVATAIPRYVGLSYGQKTPQDPSLPVVVAAGRQTPDADIELPETKVLAGRIVDEYGDPAPNVTVVLAQNGVAAGKTRLMPLSGGTVTDDLGEFRLGNVSPGTFFLMALSGPFASGNVLGGPVGPPSSGYGFALTFFPGTARPADAQPVRIDVRGVTPSIAFALVPSDMGKVSGRVIDRSGLPVSNANVLLLQLHNGDIRMIVPARTTVDADGFFSIDNVPVGSFVAQAIGRGGFARATVTVSPRETATVELTTAPPSAVRGRIVIEGAPDSSLLKKIAISAIPTDFVRGPAGVVQPMRVIKDDGTFEVSGLLGVNILRFDLPLPWTLVSMSSGGADITDRPIDSSAGDLDDLRVTFAPTASTVVCRVNDKNGQQLLKGFVLIFEQDPARWTYPSRYVRGLTADANGDFNTTALPPGRYLAVPFAAVPRPDWMNPDFLEKLRALGHSFAVDPSESIRVRLELR